MGARGVIRRQTGRADEAVAKAVRAAFGAAVLFLAGNRARVYYQSVKSKEELEADLRENRRAMQALEGKSFADGDDPFEGMEPHEIEALLRQNAPDGDLCAGMAPDEINAYLAKQQEEQVGKHLSMPRNIPRRGDASASVGTILR